ncbi:DctP family TRAP transporter solute-binding subunit [Brevibacillus ruminantium]|uniref:DctP family TRAP transporter solute-binding subunit n=1 Tax=Brevibacillus ruminantium TaxID=2950604 RepID=A0ABY4WEK2_9BACL|nr:DctP family TRAP transporter solute-binding subunit [Brevibacillus ruminantium]USG65608.1 DctP family TRAP transporter solute-binding subunit [Brevibacillus ruminantium]
MKKAVGFGLSILLAVSLAACGSPKTNDSSTGQASGGGASKDELKLKVSITVSEKDTWGVAVKKWIEEVDQKSNGRIKMKMYANESLSNGNQPKGLEAVQNGATDISLHSTIIYNVLDPKFAAPSLPWLIPSYEQADKAMNGEAGEKLMELVRSKGIEPLAFGESGYRQITNSKRPIVTPDDLKGLKIRTPSMEAMVGTFKEFGGDPTVMNFSEVFTSLQQGVIDGQENPLPIILNSKLYEVQKYMTVWNYIYDPIVFGVNKKLYDSLDPDTQKLLRETAQEAAKYQIELNRSENDKVLAELKEKGMEVVELTPEQIKVFQEKVQPVIDKYEEIIGKDLLDAFRK